MRLENKVAIITGAGQSQGRVATLMFCKEGAKVVAVDWHSDAVNETVRMARELGGDAVACHADVRKETQVARVVQLAIENYSRLNVLYNNAAVDPMAGLVTDISERALSFVIDVNLKGPFFFCKHAIPEMIRSGGGSIINVASIAVLIGSSTGDAAYTATKSGIRGLTRSLAAEFAAQRIRCNCILPGGVVSEGHKHMLEHPEILERRRHAFNVSIGPMERFGRPEEIVWAAIYLASDESTWTTGAELVIDGGAAISRHLFKGDMLEAIKGSNVAP